MGLSHLADRLATIFQRYPPASKECVACVREVQRLLHSQVYSRTRPRHSCLLGQYFYTRDGVCFAGTGFHVAVVNDLLVNALTGSGQATA